MCSCINFDLIYLTTFIILGENFNLNKTQNSNDYFIELHSYAMSHNPICKQEVVEKVNEPKAKITVVNISQPYQVIIT